MVGLSPRQLTVVILGTALATGIPIALIADATRVAAALIAGLNLVLLFGLIQLARRIAQVQRTLDRQRRPAAFQTTGGASITSKSSRSATGAKKYWQRRQNHMYYKYVRDMARALAADARSALDVGSHTTPILEELEWIPRRDALDLRNPYHSENVRGIRSDFLEFAPSERYDFALCLQVLEHVPEAEEFGKHLREVARNVLVSVPFMWSDGARGHVHDPVSREKLVQWMDGDPDHELLVPEPFANPGRGTRLIAYYHSPDAEFSLRETRSKMVEMQSRG